MTEGLTHEQPYDLQDNTKCYKTDKDEKKEAALKIIAEWNKEQETKKQQGISVSEALRLHNENATVRGMIVSISQPFKMITEKIVICENESCSNKQVKIYDKPRFSVNEGRRPRDCPQCNNTEFNIDFVYTTAVSIKLQDDKPYAQNASGRGITAIIDKENDTRVLRLGAVPQSRGAICAINEIGRMNYEDQAFLLDAMEEGEFSVDKYGIHVTIKSPTTIVATANPTGTKWNDPVKISNVEIPVLKSLLDRFDQIYAFNEFSSPQEDREYAQRKADMDSKNIRYSHQYLKTYLAYANTINPITITPDAKLMLIDFWLEVKAKGLATNRTLDSIFRMTKAHARLHLVEVVDADIAAEFMSYYKQTMLQYGEIVKTIESPRDVAYREMLTIVKQAQGPIELITAAKMACDRNEQVRSYLGNNRLDLKHNWKLQTVREMLVNNPSIKQMKEKPIVLQWFESSTSHASHASHNEYRTKQSQTSICKIYAKACDVSEVCDETITHSQNNISNNGSNHNRPALPLLILIPPLPVLSSQLVPNVQTSTLSLNKDYKTVVEKGEDMNLTSSNSSKKDNTEVVKEHEETKRRILEENPNIPKDTLEFMLSLPVERKIPKVTEQETVHATVEQQEEMERLLKKNKN